MEQPHYNLYYIFKEDSQAHPLPPPRAEAIWQAILQHLAKQ